MNSLVGDEAATLALLQAASLVDTSLEATTTGNNNLQINGVNSNNTVAVVKKNSSKFPFFTKILNKSWYIV